MKIIKCDNGNIMMVLKEVEDASKRELRANSVDAAVEKHVPTYEVKDGKIFVKVNHVMEEDHSIEWISIVFDGKEVTTYLEPGKEAVTHCKYVPGSVIYAYCNKHSLWMGEVE